MLIMEFLADLGLIVIAIAIAAAWPPVACEALVIGTFTARLVVHFAHRSAPTPPPPASPKAPGAPPHPRRRP